MSETARALGMPGQIEWQGKTLAVSPVTFKLEALFEIFLEGNRDRALERARSRMSAEAYRDRLREANAQDGGRAFSWDGDIARGVAWGDVGFRELSFLCILEKQPDWTRQQHEELLADGGKAVELFRIVHKITAPHPNGSAPGQQPGASS